MWLGLLRKLQEVVRVCSPCGLQFTMALEAFQPKLADRLQHGEPGFVTFALCLLHQALVKQGCDSLKHREGLLTAHPAHGFGRIERAAADEDGEPAAEALLLCRQRVIAPLE